MPNFSPPEVTFQDGPGYGYWDDGHAREHLQFVQVLAGKTPPVLLPNYDFIQMLTAGSSRNSIWESHSEAHRQLRQVTGVGGVDYSQVNLDNSDDFYSFLSDHDTEHAAIRTALGLI